MCVGGSPVDNNAVCFGLPDHVRDRWLDPAGPDAGLDPDRLADAFLPVRPFLKVAHATPAGPLDPRAAQVIPHLHKKPPPTPACAAGQTDQPLPAGEYRS